MAQHSPSRVRREAKRKAKQDSKLRHMQRYSEYFGHTTTGHNTMVDEVEHDAVIGQSTTTDVEDHLHHGEHDAGTAQDYSTLSLKQLRTACVERGLPKYGNKPDLIERLINADTV